jgi:hypothetical protein
MELSEAVKGRLDSLPFLSGKFKQSKDNSLFSWKRGRYHRMRFFHEKTVCQSAPQLAGCLVPWVLGL